MQNTSIERDLKFYSRLDIWEKIVIFEEMNYLIDKTL